MKLIRPVLELNAFSVAVCPPVIPPLFICIAPADIRHCRPPVAELGPEAVPPIIVDAYEGDKLESTRTTNPDPIAEEDDRELYIPLPDVEDAEVNVTPVGDELYTGFPEMLLAPDVKEIVLFP
jgi:hypothetical protein